MRLITRQIEGRRNISSAFSPYTRIVIMNTELASGEPATVVQHSTDFLPPTEKPIWSKLISNQFAVARNCLRALVIYVRAGTPPTTWAGIGQRWLVMMTLVAVIFGVFAIALIVLLIYNSTLTMRRDDQLFLDDASSHMHDEQTELLAKVNRLTIPVRVFSIGSAVFLMVLVAMWLYQKLNGVQ